MAIFYNTDTLPAFKDAVITIGTFDGVHMGHKVILQQIVKHAKEAGGESILITFEPHPRKLIAPDQPLKILTPLEQKLQLVLNEGVDHVVVAPFTQAFAGLSAEAYIKDFLVAKFKPKAIVIGYDHRFGHDRAGDIDLLKKYAATHSYTVYEIPAQLIEEAAVSSTKIRNAIQAGHVSEATQMLGRHYSITGTVISGAKLGRTIGFPTANVQPQDADQLIPEKGVYAVQLQWKGQAYNGMLNIGNRPTVSNELILHIEAHLFDFNEDIYNEMVEIIFVQRLRDEVKFPSLDALKEQLQKDKAAAMHALL
ncbi:MAG TPA: bifunctional riboflavin kinase/FAD synthetase [Flavipsychrobacter sp.]